MTTMAPAVFYGGTRTGTRAGSFSRTRRLLIETWSDRGSSDESPTVVESRKWLEATLSRVNSLIASAGSQGVPQVDLNVVVSAIQLLGRVMADDTIAPQVVPRFNGGLQFEWHVNDVDLEISFDPDGSRTAWCEHASGREWEDESGQLQIGRLRKELSLLVDE